MLYYGFLILSVVLFGGGFALQDIFRKLRGGSLKISMESAFISSVSGIIILLIINGAVWEFTWFTFLTALVASINVVAFTFFTFKALGFVNLSLYSLFSMLGGMALPFLQGILFYGEGFTVAKGVCVAFIIASLLFTLDKGDKKKGTMFCIGVFILNGLSGVITKFFTASDFPKTSAESYNLWINIFTLTLSVIAWGVLALIEKRSFRESSSTQPQISKKLLWKSYGVISIYGAINRVASFLLVVALSQIDASVQYPMVTGGTIIVCTIINFFSGKKPSKNEMISIVLAVISMFALFLIPV